MNGEKAVRTNQLYEGERMDFRVILFILLLVPVIAGAASGKPHMLVDDNGNSWQASNLINVQGGAGA